MCLELLAFINKRTASKRAKDYMHSEGNTAMMTAPAAPIHACSHHSFPHNCLQLYLRLGHLQAHKPSKQGSAVTRLKPKGKVLWKN